MTDFILPDCDEWGTPKTKMPNCPNCGDDELGMVWPGHAMCYACGWMIDDGEEIRPLTAEEAEAAFRDAPAIPISEEEIDRIVADVTNNPEPQE